MNNATLTDRLAGSGLLPAAADLHARLVGLLATGCGVTLDLSEIGAVDISFVQLLVSATLTAERNGRSLTLTGVGPDLHVAFARAGIAFDPAVGHITCN